MTTPQPDEDGTITRPQTPPGEVYVPNPPHPEVYFGTLQGDTPPSTSNR